MSGSLAIMSLLSGTTHRQYAYICGCSFRLFPRPTFKRQAHISGWRRTIPVRTPKTGMQHKGEFCNHSGIAKRHTFFLPLWAFLTAFLTWLFILFTAFFGHTTRLHNRAREVITHHRLLLQTFFRTDHEFVV